MNEAFGSSPIADMFGQTVDLVERLKVQKKVTHEILVLPDEVHGFYRYESWLRSFEATTDFFNRNLLH